MRIFCSFYHVFIALLSALASKSSKWLSVLKGVKSAEDGFELSHSRVKDGVKLSHSRIKDGVKLNHSRVKDGVKLGHSRAKDGGRLGKRCGEVDAITITVPHKWHFWFLAPTFS